MKLRIIIWLLPVLSLACAGPVAYDSMLYRLDLAVGTHDFKGAAKLVEELSNRRLSDRQMCKLHLYKARCFRLQGEYGPAIKELDRIKSGCQSLADESAWGLFELGLIAENANYFRIAINIFARVLFVYPDTAAAHPALFEMVSLAKRQGMDVKSILKKAYMLHQDSEMAAEVLATLARLAKGRLRWQSLKILARRFPNHPLGARARFLLTKAREKEHPVKALERLYDLAFGTETSLFIGSYATGVEGKALLESARVWDLYLNNPARAERDYRRFIRLYPNNSKVDDTLFEVYKMYMRRGRRTKAMQVLKELAARFPERAMGMKAADMLKGEK